MLNESNEEQPTASDSNLSLQRLSAQQKQQPAHDKIWKTGASTVHRDFERVERASKNFEDKVKEKNRLSPTKRLGTDTVIVFLTPS